MAAAEEKRQADVQAATDQRQAEVDELNEKLATARSKNRTLTSKLKVDNEALEQIKEEIRAVFEIYDFIEDVTISGGEPLMHPELDEIINYCLSFRKQYKNLRIFTNGTIVPKDSLVDLIVENRNTLSLVIDDYGPTLSKQVTKIVNIMEQYGIHVRVNCYHGNEQHCGGWIDYGSPSTYRDYSAEYVQSMYQHCHVAQYRCIGVFNGKMTNCCWAVFGNELGYMPLPSGENQLICWIILYPSKRKKRLRLILVRIRYGHANTVMALTLKTQSVTRLAYRYDLPF